MRQLRREPSTFPLTKTYRFKGAMTMISLQQLEQQRPTQYHPPKPKRKRVGLRKAAPTLWTLVCLSCFVWAACSAFSAGTSAGTVPANTSTTTYAVKSGDTEWSIAERYQTSDEDTRQVVAWIEAHNTLDGNGDLQVGRVLTVPVGR